MSLSFLSACVGGPQPVYEAPHGPGTLKAYINQPSAMYAGNKNLILQVDDLPQIAPQWSLVGQEPPYRPDVYGTAPVRYFDTTATTMRLRPDMETWDRQRRMLYLDKQLYSPADFERVAQTLALGLPALEKTLFNHADEATRKTGVYQVAGVVYGNVEDFTAHYQGGGYDLAIRPDGQPLGVEWVSASGSGPALRISVGDSTRVKMAALAATVNPQTKRRLRDDFPIVIEQYDPTAPADVRPAVVVWSEPGK